MITLTESIKIDDERLSVHREGTANPRKEKNLGHIVCWVSDYPFGDNEDDPYEGPGGLLEELCPHEQIEGLHCVSESFKEALEELSPGILLYELYGSWNIKDQLYLNFQGETKSVGCTYMTKDEIISRYGSYNEKARTSALYDLAKELADYNRYLQNESFGYQIDRIHVCSECGKTISEPLDTCGGFECLEDIVEHLKDQWYEFATKLNEVLENDED